MGDAPIVATAALARPAHTNFVPFLGETGDIVVAGEHMVERATIEAADVGDQIDRTLASRES